MVFIWFSLKCETKNGTGNISAQIDLSVFQYYFKQTYVRKNPEITLIYEILNLNLKKGMNRKPNQALHLK